MLFKRYFRGRIKYKKFVQKLRQRTEEDWIESWGDRINDIGKVCLVIEKEMDLPNRFLMPEDPLWLVFFNLSHDMREISALMKVSDVCAVSLDEYFNMNMADLIPHTVNQKIRKLSENDSSDVTSEYLGSNKNL